MIELMIVAALIVLMLALSASALFSLGSALALTQAGEMVGDTILSARQQAVASSNAVEVRFYDLTTDDDDDVVTTMQLVQQRNDGTYRASNPVLITDGVGISRDALLTSFYRNGPSANVLIRGKAGQSLPGDENAAFVAFRFHPDGSTNLSADKWFLTLLVESAVGGPIPDNFFTIQIDPLLGQIQVFRP